MTKQFERETARAQQIHTESMGLSPLEQEVKFLRLRSAVNEQSVTGEKFNFCYSSRYWWQYCVSYHISKSGGSLDQSPVHNRFWGRPEQWADGIHSANVRGVTHAVDFDRARC